ncbi:MAG: diaminopimelate dehydrogenase [Bowdeniella nasicola]|nr:diaminopimelate dehydrogenase [Bowdeniella nasicola]
MTTRVALAGYGNLGRAFAALVEAQEDMELVAVFSRRPEITAPAPVIPLDQAEQHAADVDVLALCLGSATDIPALAPGLARTFTTVDTYDNHHLIPDHRAAMDEAARAGGNVAVISTGWDPGLFSLNRALAGALFPAPSQQTFWGEGVSQGHSDAVRRITGVRRAVQYTVPAEQALNAARAGDADQLSATDVHTRVVYVVADEADHERIASEIVSMPDYFEPYETSVTFIDEETFEAEHTGMPHGGHVITTGTLAQARATVEFALTLESNPEFTAAVQVAYVRAAARLREAGQTGAFTVFDIAPALLTRESVDDLVSNLL